jgi:hypothetical protein
MAASSRREAARWSQQAGQADRALDFDQRTSKPSSFYHTLPAFASYASVHTCKRKQLYTSIKANKTH